MSRSEGYATTAKAGAHVSGSCKADRWGTVFAAAAASIAVSLWAGGAVAQTAAPAENLPIQLQADSGIEWQQNAHLYIARGNAVAIRGPSEVHADTLIAHYREAKGGAAVSTVTTGNTEIYRVEADGHVTLKRNEQTAVGDHAVYDVDQAIAVLTGQGLKLTTASDVVTARDSLEWYDQKQIAVARGNAVAIRNGKTVKADILVAHMVKTAPPPAPGKPGTPPAKAVPAAAKSPAGGGPDAAGSESKISRVDAQGHVVINNGPDTGRGDYGVYNAETGIATLIQNVVIERGKDVIRGQRGVMDLNKNVSRMLPASSGPSAGQSAAAGAPHQRVQGLFVREDQATRAATAKPEAGAGAAEAGNKRP